VVAESIRARGTSAAVFQPHSIAFFPFGPDQQVSRTIVDGVHCVHGIPDQIQDDLLQLNTIGRDELEAIGQFRSHHHPATLELTKRQRADGIAISGDSVFTTRPLCSTCCHILTR
jgi:hypothetical protein